MPSLRSLLVTTPVLATLAVVIFFTVLTFPTIAILVLLWYWYSNRTISTTLTSTGTTTKPSNQFISRKAKQKYLVSEDWKTKRLYVLNRDNHQCQSCGSSNYLQIHHISYVKLLNEDLDKDLITLCSTCHTSLHERLGYDRTTTYPIGEPDVQPNSTPTS